MVAIFERRDTLSTRINNRQDFQENSISIISISITDEAHQRVYAKNN
jgi:hypothetical protein